MRLLPHGWTSAKVADLGTWRGGGTPSKSNSDFWSGTIPWVSAKDMKSFHLSDTRDHITQEAVETSSTTVVGADTVLMVTRSGILRHSLPVAVTRMSAAINQDLKALSPRADVLPEYAAWAFRAFARDILHSCSKAGTTVQSIEFGRFKEYSIPLAPLPEQRRIVEAIEEQFSRLDAATESLRRVEKRLAGFRLAALLTALPDAYQVLPLGELLLSLRNGVFVSRPAIDPPGVPIFRISAVRPMALNIDDVRYAAVEPSEVSSYFVEEGDLLFTRYSGNPRFVGACARVPHLREPTLHPDKLIRAVVDTSVADAGFLELALSVGHARNEIEHRLKTTAGQVGISGGQLKSIPVVVPPLHVQRELAGAVSEQTSGADSLADGLRSAQLRAASLRQAILREAFAGRLVPQDASDQPILREETLA